MINIVSVEKYLQRNFFGLKAVKGILLGVGTYYKLYFGLLSRDNTTVNNFLSHLVFRLSCS